jgi:hypothetical protein
MDRPITPVPIQPMRVVAPICMAAIYGGRQRACNVYGAGGVTMKKLLLGAFALVPYVAFADTNPMGSSSSVQMPDKAQLLGTSEAVEFHEFPELQKGQGANKQPMERMTGVMATDKVYQSDRSFNATISFFDKMLKDNYTVMAKITTPSATGWTLRSSDGKLTNLIVRNTQPKATIESIEATEAQGTMNMNQPGTKDMPGTKEMPGMNKDMPMNKNMPSSPRNPGTNY